MTQSWRSWCQQRLHTMYLAFTGQIPQVIIVVAVSDSSDEEEDTFAHTPEPDDHDEEEEDYLEEGE